MKKEEAKKVEIKQEAPAEPQAVEAVGVAVTSAKRRVFAQHLERAMSDAAAKAMAEGVTDPAEIRARMLAARETAKQDI